MGRVVVVGSLNVDLVTRVERLPQGGETVLGSSLVRSAGGKGANQAVAAAEAGAEVVMVGSLGADDGGRAYLKRLQDKGVKPELVVRDDTPTGTALITVDDAGENVIVVVPGSNAELRGDEAVARMGHLGTGDVVLLQLEIPLETVAISVRAAAAAGARVVLNCAPYAALPADVIALADPLVVNESEAALLADGEMLPTSLLVTFGGAGATWDGQRVYAPQLRPSEVVDTTGAGDAFCGALAAALADGADRSTALERATAAGAAAVQRQGAQADPQL